MNVSLTLWVLTIVGLAALIAVDFFIGRKPHDVSIKEAGIWTVVWIALAGLFGLGLLIFGGGQPSGEFFAGFITEKSLSVDNLFVFVLIMAKFAVPSQYQQRVLLIGVLIALVLRAIFIAAGAAILASFAWVFYLFGAFLIWTAWKLIQEARADEEDEEFEENKLLKAVEQRFGVADRYHGTKLWIQENGKRVMTPMLVVMLAIGTTDVLFALDSIPAIFGLTQDPYIVFTANAFALMGLRQLYFLIGGLLRKLVHLSYGLSIILGFIGVKLVLHALHESGVSEGQHRGLTASDVRTTTRERCAAHCRAPLPVRCEELFAETDQAWRIAPRGPAPLGVAGLAEGVSPTIKTGRGGRSATRRRSDHRLAGAAARDRRRTELRPPRQGAGRPQPGPRLGDGRHRPDRPPRSPWHPPAHQPSRTRPGCHSHGAGAAVRGGEFPDPVAGSCHRTPGRHASRGVRHLSGAGDHPLAGA